MRLTQPVGFTPVAREAAHKKCCGPLPKTVDAHGCSVRLQSVNQSSSLAAPYGCAAAEAIRLL